MATLRVLTIPVTLAAGLIGGSAALAEASESVDPSRLIQRMSTALQTLNYEGTFVHIQSGSLTSMRILHSSDAHGQLEHMISLNGEAREVIRNHARVTCIWPGSQSVVVSKSKPRNALPEVDASLVTNQSYQLRLLQPDRVAGVYTHVVEIQPIDQYRYGYRFWIDQQNGMLLRSEMLDGDNHPIEQVMFTAISYPDHIDASRFDIKVNEDQVSWIEPKEVKSTLAASGQPDRVRFTTLPDGYREVSETYRSMPINDGPVSHVMVSDGMASVSVYVEYVAVAEQDKAALGLSTMGAMNAFGLSHVDAFITVVGEVPGDTVRVIAEAVRLNK